MKSFISLLCFLFTFIIGISNAAAQKPDSTCNTYELVPTPACTAIPKNSNNLPSASVDFLSAIKVSDSIYSVTFTFSVDLSYDIKYIENIHFLGLIPGDGDNKYLYNTDYDTPADLPSPYNWKTTLEMYIDKENCLPFFTIQYNINHLPEVNFVADYQFNCNTDNYNLNQQYFPKY
ncbi:hypothetical protein C6P40_002544, partial [Pichia californica]